LPAAPGDLPELTVILPVFNEAQNLALLWPDAQWLAPYSVFHYLPASEVLAGHLDPADLLVLGCVLLVSVAYALIVFPRRDLAAPS